MTSYTRIPIHMMVAFGAIVWTSSVQCATKCTIPPGTSTRSAPNQDALDFAFTDIKSTPEFISLAIEDHAYTVKDCVLTVYIKSAIISQNFLPADTKVSGVPLSCRSLGENAIQATGTILRYFDDAVAKPDAVPDKWYEGDRLVLRIQFFVFPEPSSVTIRCGLTQTIDFLGKVEVFEDVTVTKIGCPKSHWGTKCSKACSCENGGYCNTFVDGCICIGDYDGATCNIHFGSSTPDSAQLANTTLYKSESTDNKYSTQMTTAEVLDTTGFRRDSKIKALVRDDSGSMPISRLSTSYIFNYLCSLTVLILFNKYLS